MNEQMKKIFRHDPNIITRMIGGEMILVPIRQNVGDMEHIYTLNETAARIWKLIDGQRNLAEIFDLVIEEFEIDPLEAQVDLIELVENLEEQKVILPT